MKQKENRLLPVLVLFVTGLCGVKANAQGSINFYRVYANGGAISATYDRAPTTNMKALYPDMTSGRDIWQAFLHSGYVLGNKSSQVRGRDVFEDAHLNFIRPDMADRNYYWDVGYTVDAYVSRTSFPLTLSNGESVIGNDNIIAMGDDNFLYLNPNKTFTLYNYPGGTVEIAYTWTVFTGGVWQGQNLADKWQYFIGYEDSYLYFLEGDSSVTQYSLTGSAGTQYECILKGALAGHTLGAIVDGRDAEYTFLGMGLGGVFDIAAVAPAAPIPEPSFALLSLFGGAAFLFKRRRRVA